MPSKTLYYVCLRINGVHYWRAWRGGKWSGLVNPRPDFVEIQLCDQRGGDFPPL